MGNNIPKSHFPGIKLKGEERSRKLYHYTSFDTFIKIWCTKKLKFGHLGEVNDLLEVNGEIQTEIQQIPLIFAYRDVRNSFKQISFTMDFDSYIKGCMSPLMWGIYGDKRKGVCIELDYQLLNIPDDCYKGIVKYRKAMTASISMPTAIKSIKDIKKLIKKKSNKIFFYKELSWQGENEFRIVSDKYDFLDISAAISAVYLTSCDSIECICTEALIKEECEVRFIDYITFRQNSIPVSKNSKQTRESIKRANNNPGNAIQSISKQASDYYVMRKQDENASLLLDRYSLNEV